MFVAVAGHPNIDIMMGYALASALLAVTLTTIIESRFNGA